MKKFKQTIYHLIDGNRGTHKADAYVDMFISGLIVLNVIAIFLGTYEEIRVKYQSILYAFEVFSVCVFLVEYALRIWTADLLYPHLSKVRARLKFMTSFFGLVDLFALLPFFIPLVIKVDLRILRILRLLRLIRIFKLGRHSQSFKLFADVIRETRFDLMVTLFATFVMLLLSATIMYYVENEAQPDKFENIGEALWWAVATLTTVGYGDIYPVTAFGKILSSFIAVLGIGVVALPTAIISSSIIAKMAARKAKNNNEQESKTCECPHCGKEIKQS
ncbi:MAG: ion transporter [Flavobacteriales bacterium]|nr:ion transporter [Flavobacteriales bacterium]